MWTYPHSIKIQSESEELKKCPKILSHEKGKSK